jgi:hypothetical protein
MNNGSFIEIDRDERVDVDALSNERWAVIKSEKEAYYLNIAQITIIEEKVI